MGDKWVMVCISHRLGARYYVGTWKDEQLHPEYHELMTFSDNEYFAPENHTDDRGRRILFAWVFDGRSDAVRGASGWSGMMALPRVMTLGSDHRLLMMPVEELQRLRYNPVIHQECAIPGDGETAICFDAVSDNVLELEVELTGTGATELGVKLCCTPDGSDETPVGYEVDKSRLKIDTTRTGP